MSKRRCIPCGGSGKVMGGGMLISDCEHCDGEGKVIDDNALFAKDTEHYKKAKSDIKAIDKAMTDEEAEKILDEEIEKQKPKGKKK